MPTAPAEYVEYFLKAWQPLCCASKVGGSAVCGTTRLQPDAIAGYACLVDGTSLLDSNSGGIASDCDELDGTWHSYDCSTAESHVPNLPADYVQHFIEAWQPLCCSSELADCVETTRNAPEPTSEPTTMPEPTSPPFENGDKATVESSGACTDGNLPESWGADSSADFCGSSKYPTAGANNYCGYFDFQKHCCECGGGRTSTSTVATTTTSTGEATEEENDAETTMPTGMGNNNGCRRLRDRRFDFESVTSERVSSPAQLVSDMHHISTPLRVTLREKLLIK